MDIIERNTFDPFIFIDVDPDEGDSTWDFYHQPENGYYTSSMISDIIGVGYNSCRKRWQMMITPPGTDGTRREIENSFARQAVEHGQLLEPEGIESFFNHFPVWTGCKPGMAFLEEKILASTDQVLCHNNTGELALLEVKCPLSPKDYVFGHELPPKYIIQCLVEMACWRIYKLYLWIYQPFSDSPFPHQIGFEIKYSQQIMDMILKEIHDFDELYVKQRKDPGRKMKDSHLLRLLASCAIKIT